MELYRELVVHANAATMVNQLTEKIKKALPKGWTNSASHECQINTSMSGSGPMLSFLCAQDGDRRNAIVILAPKDRASYHVANIVPFGESLTPREYNRILEDFYRAVLLPVAEKEGVKVELSTNERVELSQRISPETAAKFQHFLRIANKFTGLPPQKEASAWNDFVLSSHRDGERCRLDAPLLRRWLIEEEGWPENIAAELASSYQSGRELLAYLEKERRSA